MGINGKIMDKIVEKCKKDLNKRVFITEVLRIESDRISHYKARYKELIEQYCIGDEKNEDK